MTDFNWDDDKAAQNLAKHGVAFDQAAEIFEGWVLTRPDDRRDYGEDRYVSLGRRRDGRLLVVVYTERAGTVRVISARKANAREQTLFDRAEQERST